MAPLRSPRDELPSSRRVNFRDNDHSYNTALHPPPMRNYSNPAAASSSYDVTDFARRNMPHALEPQQSLEDSRKGSKLTKRQTGTASRSIRDRFFGNFRSKKTPSQDLPRHLAEEKTSQSGAKYMEIKSKHEAAELDKSKYYDSAWTTAHTTARPSVDLTDTEFEHQVPSRGSRLQDLQTSPTTQQRPPSSRYSLRLSNDHMHEMIGELQSDQPSAASRDPAPVRHISHYYKPKLHNPSASEERTSAALPQRESLRHSRSMTDISAMLNSKTKLNAELEALRSMKRIETPELIGASGHATDPRLALCSHPTASLHPSAASNASDSRSISSLSTQATPHPLRRSQTQLELDAVSAVTSVGHLQQLRNQSRIPPALDTQAAAPKPSLTRVGATSPLSTKAPFYYSESENESNATDRFSSHAKAISTGSPHHTHAQKQPPHAAKDSTDSTTLGQANKDVSFWDSPRASPQTERASERANKVRERKLRDRKASLGGTPPLASARGSLEELAERTSSSSERQRYPKDAATKKGSPINRDAPPMPAVPPPGLFDDQATRSGSSRENSLHSNQSSSPVAPGASQRGTFTPSAPTRPSPLPPTDGPFETSRVMTVAATTPARSPTSQTFLSSHRLLQQARVSNGDGASSSAAQARIAELEHKNKLLEAALHAVLATNGRINGCPCQGTGAAQGADALETYRLTRDPSRLSVHSGVGPLS